MIGVSLLVVLLASAGEAPAGDARSHELVHYECVSELGSEAITLFANGTARVRRRSETPESVDELLLLELSPDELDAYRNRLRAEDLREVESPRFGPVGEWVEQCTLELDLAERAPLRFRFGRYDSLALNLSRVLAVVDQLGAEVVERESSSGLPPGYRPRPGDLLVRRDGRQYEIVGFTWDGNGLELRSIDQPLLLYLPVDAVTREFDRLIGRDELP